MVLNKLAEETMEPMATIVCVKVLGDWTQTSIVPTFIKGKRKTQLDFSARELTREKDQKMRVYLLGQGGHDDYRPTWIF